VLDHGFDVSSSAAMRSKRSLEVDEGQEYTNHANASSGGAADHGKRARTDVLPSVSEAAEAEQQAAAEPPSQSRLHADAAAAPQPQARPGRVAAQAANARIRRCAALEEREEALDGSRSTGRSNSSGRGACDSGLTPDASGEPSSGSEDDGEERPEGAGRHRGGGPSAPEQQGGGAAMQQPPQPRARGDGAGEGAGLWPAVSFQYQAFQIAQGRPWARRPRGVKRAARAHQCCFVPTATL
jgi:hypothetical protein